MKKMLKRPPSSDVTKSIFVKKSSAQRSNPLLSANYIIIQQDPGSCWTGTCLPTMQDQTNQLCYAWTSELYCTKCNRRFKLRANDFLSILNKKNYFLACIAVSFFLH